MTLFAAWLLPTLFVVDAANGPGTTHLDLAAALAVAQAGDTIVVRAGTYSGGNLQPGLTVRGDGAATVTVNGGLTMLGGSSSLHTHVSGLTCEGGIGVQFGHLVLEHCVVRGSSGSGHTALGVANGHVSASQCTFRGGDLVISTSGGFGAAGNAVLVTFFGSFTANDCDLRGGDCIVPPNVSVVSSFGGIAIATNRGSAELRGGSYRGGDNSAHDGVSAGGLACEARLAGFVTFAGDAATVVAGGNGLAVGGSIYSSMGSVAAVHGPVTLSAAPIGPVLVGAPALPRVAVTGSVLADGALDSLQPASITYEGLVPGAVFFYQLGLAPRRLSISPLGPLGDLMIDQGSAATMFGVLDAAGQFSLGFVPVSLLGTALLQVPLHAQAGTLDAANGAWRTSNCDIHRYGL